MPARVNSSVQFSRLCSSCTCLLVALLSAASLSIAGTITVRKDGAGDFIVLHEALSAAADGDSILIGPGEFTEMTWVRLPGWNWDAQVSGYATAQDLTIIGSGLEQTVIGPTSYFGSSATSSPIGIVHTDGGTLAIKDLTVRNCYTDVYVIGTIEMSNCLMDKSEVCIFWPATGNGGWIRDSVIRSGLGLSPTGLWVLPYGGGAGITMERCRSEGVETIIDGIEGMTIVGSEFIDEVIGISIYNNGRVYLQDCVVSEMSRYGVRFSFGSDGYCEIRDSEVSGGWAALDTGGNALRPRFVVEGSRLVGGSVAVLRARYRPGPCQVVASDLIKGSGPVVQCSPSYEVVTHDLRSNYWGTANEAEIQSWVIDQYDDPEIPATVLYSPFEGQPVSIESTTWSELKVLYR